MQKDRIAEIDTIDEVHASLRKRSLIAGFEVGDLVVNRKTSKYIGPIGSVLKILEQIHCFVIV